MRINYERYLTEETEQVKRFEAGLPHAKVVRIANAQHNDCNSNTDDVVREMIAFIDGLK